jgi:beta-galactosidase
VDSNYGKAKIVYTGHTGSLPHVGVGWYRKLVDIPASAMGKKAFIQFDGAMSHARIYCNGTYMGTRPYGYSSFDFELTDHIRFGEKNLIAVRLENPPKLTNNWYPGTGIYRNVHQVMTDPVHIPQWGTYITTSEISEGSATMKIQTGVVNSASESQNIQLIT